MNSQLNKTERSQGARSSGSPEAWHWRNLPPALRVVRLVCVAVGLVLCELHALGQETIVYSGFAGRWLGGSLIVPGGSATDIDLDGDGRAELSFSGSFLATPGNPSFHTDTFSVSPATHASVALGGEDSRLVSAGTMIGPSLSPVWSGAPSAWPLLTLSYVTPTPLPDPEHPNSGGEVSNPQAAGLLAEAGGMAFLGAQWQMTDGLHYGWVRLSSDSMPHPDIPTLIFFGPLVVDWAYETRPDTAILAGAVPEPSTWALLGAGGVLLWWHGRRKRMG